LHWIEAHEFTGIEFAKKLLGGMFFHPFIQIMGSPVILWTTRSEGYAAFARMILDFLFLPQHHEPASTIKKSG
jgi:hypothetical protein